MCVYSLNDFMINSLHRNCPDHFQHRPDSINPSVYTEYIYKKEQTKMPKYY